MLNVILFVGHIVLVDLDMCHDIISSNLIEI